MLANCNVYHCIPKQLSLTGKYVEIHYNTYINYIQLSVSDIKYIYIYCSVHLYCNILNIYTYIRVLCKSIFHTCIYIQSMCPTVFLYMYISIYLYLYLYVSVSIYIYLYLHLSIFIYIYLPISIYIYLSIYLSIYIYIYISISIYLYLSISIYIYLYLSISICI